MKYKAYVTPHGGLSAQLVKELSEDAHKRLKKTNPYFKYFQKLRKAK